MQIDVWVSEEVPLSLSEKQYQGLELKDLHRRASSPGSRESRILSWGTLIGSSIAASSSSLLRIFQSPVVGRIRSR
jgi:hypothetical protein